MGEALRSHTGLHVPAPKVSLGEIQHHGESQHHRGFSTTDRPRARGDSAPWRGPAHTPRWALPLTREPHTQLTLQVLRGPAPVTPRHLTAPQTHPEHSRPRELPVEASLPRLACRNPTYSSKRAPTPSLSRSPFFWFIWGPHHAPLPAPLLGCAFPTEVSVIHVLPPHGTHQPVRNERMKLLK